MPRSLKAVHVSVPLDVDEKHPLVISNVNYLAAKKTADGATNLQFCVANITRVGGVGM